MKLFATLLLAGILPAQIPYFCGPTKPDVSWDRAVAGWQWGARGHAKRGCEWPLIVLGGPKLNTVSPPIVYGCPIYPEAPWVVFAVHWDNSEHWSEEHSVPISMKGMRFSRQLVVFHPMPPISTAFPGEEVVQ